MDDDEDEDESQANKELAREKRQEDAFFDKACGMAEEMMTNGTSSVSFHMAGTIFDGLHEVMAEQMKFYRAFIKKKTSPENRSFARKHHKVAMDRLKARLKRLKDYKADYFRRLRLHVDMHKLDGIDVD